MKRKLLALFTALLLLVTMVTPAFADLIWEPMGNNFYDKHRDECDYVNRVFRANGAEGYVTIKKAPDSAAEIMNVNNGTTLVVNFVWTDKDGIQWGIGYPAGEFDKEGWIPLSDMAMIYDHRDFAEDHSSEFKEYDGSGDALGKALVFEYPGGIVTSTLEENVGYLPFSEAFTHLYTDENGLRWTFVGYYMGRRDGWVCIDDPMNEALGAATQLTVGQVRGGEQLNPPAEENDAPPAVDTVPAPTEDVTEVLYPPVAEVPATSAFPLWLIPVILVVAVAVLTAVMVRRRRKAA